MGAALEAIASGRIIVNNSVITAKWASKNSTSLGKEGGNGQDLRSLPPSVAISGALTDGFADALGSSASTTPQTATHETAPPSQQHAPMTMTAQYTSAGEELTTLWVRNLQADTADSDFAASMEPFGQLVCCFLNRGISPQGQKSGFARFSTAEGAMGALQAIEAKAVTVRGLVLKARWARENAKPLSEEN